MTTWEGSTLGCKGSVSISISLETDMSGIDSDGNGCAA